MNEKHYHMSQSIRGPLLNWSESDWQNALNWIKGADGTLFESALQLKAAFLEHLSQGHAVIPMGDCDNFDYVRGCQGHDSEKKMVMKLANVCGNCINWESPESAEHTGMKRSPNKGYCVLFQKETDKAHGLQCTAFEAWPGDKQAMSDFVRDNTPD